jgi:hypothetical protein
MLAELLRSAGCARLLYVEAPPAPLDAGEAQPHMGEHG